MEDRERGGGEEREGEKRREREGEGEREGEMERGREREGERDWRENLMLSM